MTALARGGVRCRLATGGWCLRLAFVLLLLAGCKPRPLVCEPPRVFRVTLATRTDGGAAEGTRQLGPEVALTHLATYPGLVVFLEGKRVQVSWVFEDFGTYSEAVYSPEEGVAREVDAPHTVWPLQRFSNGATERVWLDFRAPVCIDPEALAGRAPCRKYGPEELLIADMPCRREKTRWLGSDGPLGRAARAVPRAR